MKHTAYNIPVIFTTRRMSNENMPQPNPTPNDPGSLWEAGKEVVQDAIQYTQQTAYNIGVTMGVVDPPIVPPENIEPDQIINTFQPEFHTANPEISISQPDAEAPPFHTGNPEISISQPDAEAPPFHTGNPEISISQPDMPPYEKVSSMLPKGKHFPVHRRPKQPAESHHPAEVTPPTTGNKPQKHYPIHRRPKQPAEPQHTPEVPSNPSPIVEPGNVETLETNPTPEKANTETKPQKHYPIHRRPKQPAEPHHEIPSKNIE